MFTLYRDARAHALAQANATGFSHGIEKVTMFGKGWRVFPLPRPENRFGFELRCEVVDPTVQRAVRT